MSTRSLLPGIVALLAIPTTIAHQAHNPQLEELIVYGRAEQLVGGALAASQGRVGDADLDLPPLLRVGELVEAVPGMVATQHSGTGKANQYFLRGFNLDHGTDFSAKVDGVPINLRTHGHGQGYLDLNFLMPELVESTRYRKGPYAAAAGDFSSAGSVEFNLRDRLEDSLLTLTAGEDRYGRALVAGSREAGPSTVTFALAAATYDGPWKLDEDLAQYKGVARFAFELRDVDARVTFMGYDSRWDATDQIPRRAVRDGRLDRLGFVDPDLGGRSERYSFFGRLASAHWDATAYAVVSDFTLFSNFTYFLDNPVGGDEFEQRDERLLYGLTVTGRLERSLVGRPLRIAWGGELRIDDIDTLGLHAMQGRQRIATVRSDSVDERSAGLWGEAEVQASERLRVTFGLRTDAYDYDVDALRPENSGGGHDTQTSPKASLAWRAAEGLELYANWGRGFHSNDVRGATIKVDPVSEAAVAPVDVLVQSEGAELGFRYEREPAHGCRAGRFLAGD